MFSLFIGTDYDYLSSGDTVAVLQPALPGGPDHLGQRVRFGLEHLGLSLVPAVPKSRKLTNLLPTC